MKFGRLPYRHDERTLRLKKYVDVERTERVPPLALSRLVPRIPMYKNDVWSCCGPSALGHLHIGWEAGVAHASKAKAPKPPSNADIEVLYESVTELEGGRFDPKTGENDNGVVLLDMLKVARKEGFAGSRVGAFALVDNSGAFHNWAARACGGLLKGYDLPQVVADNLNAGWTFTPGRGVRFDPNPSYGHATSEGSNNGRGWIMDGTWGAWRQVGAAFEATYCVESWAVIAPEWFDDHGLAPSGLDMEALARDLNVATGAAQS